MLITSAFWWRRSAIRFHTFRQTVLTRPFGVIPCAMAFVQAREPAIAQFVMLQAAGKKSKSYIKRAFFLLSIFYFLPVPRMAALDPHTLISQYAHTAWRVQDGFIGPANDITQTTDGYIWIASQTGLYRFDGVRFTQWKWTDRQHAPGGSIYHLLGARDGSLWIGTTTGLSHLKDGRLTIYTPAPDSPGISKILEDHTGRIWVTRYHVNGMGSLCWAKEITLECYGKKEGNPTRFGFGMAEDSLGNIWFGGDMLCRWGHGSFTSYFNDHLTNPADSAVVDVAAGSLGEIWASFGLAGSKQGVQHFSDGKWSSYIVPGFDGGTVPDANLYVDKRRALWIGTKSNGLYRMHDGVADHYGIADGLTGQNAGPMYEDREGNLWVATDRGLDLFRDNSVITFSSAQGLSGPQVRSVLAVDGDSVWVGSAGGLDVIHAGSYSFIHHQKAPGQIVNSIFEDSKGQIWLGIDNHIFVYKQGQYFEVKNADGSVLGGSSQAQGFAEDTEGNLWALSYFFRGVTHENLYLIRNRRVSKTIELGHSGALFLASDRRAGIWTLSEQGQLTHYVDGRTEKSVILDNVDSAWGLDVDSRNALWASTRNGLYRWSDGKASVMNMKSGLPCSDVDSTIQDDHGPHWFRSNCGILRITAEEWQRWQKSPESKISFTLFSALDGVEVGGEWIQNQPAITKTRDGRVWFAAGNSVQMVDPNRKSTSLSVPVHIEEVIADHKTYESLDKVALPHLRGELEIDYTALSFKIPQRVLFRYKLEGHDEDWQEVGTRRQAFYNDLPPRKYRFRVIACNSDGVWNEVGTFIDFSIRPAWYQTSWFRFCCVAAFLLLLWAAYVFRVRQLESQFAAGLETRVDERTRIARELHDTLLQSFQGAVFQFQAARRLFLRNADNVSQAMDEAIQAAEVGITEGRAAIQNLRPEPAAQRDLPEWVKSTGHELVNAHQQNGKVPAFSVVVEGKPRDLSSMVKDEVYRISLEVMRNAFAHADASKIEVEIHYDINQLRLRIRDDGKGIDPKILKAGGPPGHWGIPGMRERAQRIGSQLDFWSEVGAGTEVELTVPAAMAYENRRGGHRFRLFRRLGSGR
jgi:signal transduction histidine kinase/ligand-binding sensor domain-containing protein